MSVVKDVFLEAMPSSIFVNDDDEIKKYLLTKQCELRTPCGTSRTARGTRVTSRPISGRVRMSVRILANPFDFIAMLNLKPNLNLLLGP